jgi:hypothetical protein
MKNENWILWILAVAVAGGVWVVELPYRTRLRMQKSKSDFKKYCRRARENFNSDSIKRSL